ncbi:MAG: hypothetical protein J5857_11265 [Treponema sp.]|nr:hypothetical protein [Treponema sp.]
MRVITKEYQDMLNKCEVWNVIKNTPRPDFTEINKLSSEFELWIKNEHEKDRQILREASKK